MLINHIRILNGCVIPVDKLCRHALIQDKSLFKYRKISLYILKWMIVLAANSKTKVNIFSSKKLDVSISEKCLREDKGSNF